MTTALRVVVLSAVLLGAAVTGLSQEDEDNSAAPAPPPELVQQSSSWRLLITYDPKRMNVDDNIRSLVPEFATFHQVYRQLAEQQPLHDSTSVVQTGGTVRIADGAILWSLYATYMAPPGADWNRQLGEALAEDVKRVLGSVQEITLNSQRNRLRQALEDAHGALRDIGREHEFLSERLSKLAGSQQVQDLQNQLAALRAEIRGVELKRTDQMAHREALREMLEGRRASDQSREDASSDKTDAPEYDQAIINELRKLVSVLQNSVAAARVNFQAGQQTAQEAARMEEELIKARIELIRAQQQAGQKQTQKAQEVSADLAKLTEQLAMLQQELSASEWRLSELQHGVEELEAQRESLSKIQREREELELQHELSRNSIRQLQTEIADLKNQLRRLQSGRVEVHLLNPIDAGIH